jgi:DHA3 family tetracycline resistance protein-like MFS transporter
MTASLVGDGVFLVALAWQVYTVSNAPAALSAVGLAMSVPHVAFLLVGGVVSDRVDRRRVMVVADLVRGAAMAGLAILAWSGSRSLWPIATVAVVYGGATAFFGPSFDAIVPEVVPPELLGSANSLDQLVRPLASRLVGPAVGGWIVAATGTGAAFLLDAATFLVSAIAVGAMARSSARRAPDEDSASAVAEIREGYRYVRRHVWLWGTFAAATIAYLLFMGPTEVLVPFLVKTSLHGSAGTLGAVFAMGGVGAVTGAVLMSRRRMPRRFVAFMYLTWGVATFAVAGYGLARVPWQVMAACFAFNALETAGTIVWATAKHRLVPARLLGRVSSFDWFISIGLVPVSFALTGPVATVFGVRGTLVGAGMLGGTVTIAALLLPGLRAFERTHGEELRSDAASDQPRLDREPALVR